LHAVAVDAEPQPATVVVDELSPRPDAPLMMADDAFTDVAVHVQAAVEIAEQRAFTKDRALAGVGT